MYYIIKRLMHFLNKIVKIVANLNIRYIQYNGVSDNYNLKVILAHKN